MTTPRVSVIYGSTSDEAAMTPCFDTLKDLGIAFEARVLSAHRNPVALARYVRTLPKRGVKVVIAAAGLAAALPGVVAAHTHLPVLGVPVATGPLNGLDALFSIVQMPGGVPVGTLAIGKAGAKNSAFLAARILALSDPALSKRLLAKSKPKGAQR